MPLEKCKECGNAISNTAKVCPHCGHKQKRRSSFGKLLGVSLLATFAVVIVYGAFNPDGGTPPPTKTPEQIAADQKRSLDSGREIRARTIAEHEIRKRLKAPSGAKFSGYSGTRVARLKDGSPNEWIVKGYVDSQNSFGAMLRNKYQVVIEFEEGKDDKYWTKLAELHE